MGESNADYVVIYVVLHFRIVFPFMLTLLTTASRLHAYVWKLFGTLLGWLQGLRKFASHAILLLLHWESLLMLRPHRL